MPELRHIIKTAFIGIALASLSSVAQAPLDIRVALVIGNAAYKHIPELSNSSNDARSMSVVLKKLGFKVFDVIDGSKVEMSRAIELMQNQLKGQHAVAMLYYAGHGLQLDWRNYMVPIDAKLQKASDVPKQTVDIEEVIRVFKASGTRMNILVLDACRDNPFSGTTGSKGLAQLDAPPGTYLAFATAPGNVAEDGDAASGNGLFTQYLLKELQRPAKIEDVFKRVRLQVRQKSQGRQIPWDSSSLEDDFAFNDGKKFTFDPEDLVREARAAKENEQRLMNAAQAAAEREKRLAQERELEKLRFAEAQKIQEQQARLKAEAEAKAREKQLALAEEQERRKAAAAAQALEQARLAEAQRIKDLELAKAQALEEEQRKKMSAEAARERQFAEEKAEWDKIKDSKHAQDFYAFLLKYPNGLISQQATFALEQLDKAKITAQADKTGLVQVLGEPRYRVGDKFVRVTRDDYTGREIKKWEFVFYKIENGLAYAKSTEEEIVGTLDGAAIQTTTPRGTFKFDPPLMYLPGDEFKVGKSWSAASSQTSSLGKFMRSIHIKIVGYEQVSIQAGTFWAYKFESNGWVGTTRFEETYWHLPDWGVRIKSISKYYPPRGPASLESTELVSFTRGEKASKSASSAMTTVASRATTLR